MKTERVNGPVIVLVSPAHSFCCLKRRKCKSGGSVSLCLFSIIDSLSLTDVMQQLTQASNGPLLFVCLQRRLLVLPSVAVLLELS